ncbi:PDZ domain-containing protein, partial [Massilia oculi]|nr:PDZ domain-containing protein [Massilia oculi]
LYQTGNGFNIVTAGQKVASPTAGEVKLGGIQQLVDPAAEWKQVFNEVWSMQKDYFYVENMHGADWKAMKTKYEKFLPFVNHRSDLGYLLNEMMGEMVVGHNYIYPGDQPSTPSVSVGVLGADYTLNNGYYQIVKLFTRLEWNPSFKAPLAEPGLNIKEGDYIVAVNGTELTEDKDIYSLFDNT